MADKIDPFDKYREAIRATGMKITPYRIGHEVGLSGEILNCPYESRVSKRSYIQGLQWGARERRRNIDAPAGDK